MLSRACRGGRAHWRHSPESRGPAPTQVEALQNARIRSTLLVLGFMSTVVTVSGCPGVSSGAGGRSASEEPAGSAAPPSASGGDLEPAALEILIEGSGRVDQVRDGGGVTLTAVPDPGWVFNGWIGLDTTDNPVTIPVEAAEGIGAHFVPSDSEGPAVGDADADGVADDPDACPDTPPGDDPDDSGCGASQRDGDGDGVNDDSDECPDTAGGAAVDESGCEIIDEGPVEDACGVGDCFAAHDDGGCDYLDCCATVCAAEASCCSREWSRTCVAMAGVMCVEIEPPAAPECGDGVVGDGEECDDGNIVSGDGCDDACRVEGPEVVCGDGAVEVGEACDDGNTAGGDGCGVDCQVEPPDPVCGNGILEAGEECDDGNGVSGDGCDAGCRREPDQGPPEESTWASTQLLFLSDSKGGFFMEPESYTLDALGWLVSAQVTVDTASIEVAYAGTVVVLATAMPLGLPIDLVRVEDVFGSPGDTMTLSAVVDTFSVVLLGNEATWTFDYTVVLTFETAASGMFVIEFIATGQQTGTLSVDGTQITWIAVEGELMVCFDDMCELPTPLDEVLDLGIWTAN